MLFYTVPYLLYFLPISISLFFYGKYFKVDRKIIIIFLSIVFYSWWNIYYLPVIMFSILVNYYCCKKIISSKTKKKNFLVLGIVLNVLLLVIFKYADFIIQNINLLFSTDLIYLNLPFPLAISFFTFQSIAFLVNVYDEDILDVKAKDFFLFIIFFPQLIAGPIVKYNKMMPQFNNKANYLFNKKNFMIGLIILFIGLIKKIYFAGTLSEFVDLGHENINDLKFISSWLLSLCFTFQFYFDFSGYVDMATGSALMFNIVLPQNFNSPFKATSIIDFWQRWHITLTQFLNNFIYNPLLRSLKNINFLNSMIITFIVFFIAGIWHGPSWNFVLFGAFHGLGLIINHIYKKYIYLNLSKYIFWFLTFNFVNISFIFFRTNEIKDAIIILKKMFDINVLFNNYSVIDKFFVKFSNDSSLMICFLLAIMTCFIFKNSYTLIKNNVNKS
jgi:alginate O-acetyltransferase complex protein AlgI